jgi:hypothetical protein
MEATTTRAALAAGAVGVVTVALLWPSSNCVRAALPVGEFPNLLACPSAMGVPSSAGVALFASLVVTAVSYVAVRRRRSIAAALRDSQVDAMAVVGAIGVVLCLVALVVLRGVHLYDELHDDFRATFLTIALVLVGAVIAFVGLVRSGMNARWRHAGITVAAIALVAVVVVAALPDGTCILRCGPF